MESNKTSETAWLIENAFSFPSAPQYFAGLNGSRATGFFVQWETDHMKAVRFARKEDADAVAFGEGFRVCEHVWS